MRSLSAEEAELWAKVTATIRPLSRDPVDREAVALQAPSPVAKPKGRVPPPRPAPVPPKRIENFQSATLDGGWDRRLRSGQVEPDRVLDLHGHTLDRAWVAIDRSLERAIACSERILLLITGHERKGDKSIRICKSCDETLD